MLNMTSQEANQENSNPTKDLTIEEIRSAIPAYLFQKSEIRFLVSVGFSLSLTILTALLASKLFPLTIYALPLWILYAIVNGTISIGLWVLGHECGHGAFSDKPVINDLLGYTLHTLYLVPYFGWQHSHHIHHSRTNHIEEGETHVPHKLATQQGKNRVKTKELLGEDAFALRTMFTTLALGWPLYLLTGVTGGPARGFTSHYIVPNKLFPAKMLPKMFLTYAGLLAVIYALYLWAHYTSFYNVLALYIGPYLIANGWLTAYTKLQHIEEDIPHYDAVGWTWLKGALCTIDRAFPSYINALHFDIGSTHVLHHIFSQIPHYNAPVANEYLKQVLKDKYRFDAKSPWTSLYEVCKLTVVDHIGDGEYRFVENTASFPKKLNKKQL